MSDARTQQIEALLRERGPLPAAALAAALGISQPTISRALALMGERVVRLGRARAARYALARGIARAGSRWPLYRIQPDGQAETMGELRALHGDGYHFEAAKGMSAFLHGDFADGLFPGLPWFLDDQRPQGFLGRAFARRVADDIGAPTDLLRWQPDDIVLGLLRHGEDLPGDLVLGETALQRALQETLAPRAALASTDRTFRYPQLADAALRGEVVGSSAGGEQPKFVVTLHEDADFRPVIVKFSERTDTPAGRRWADLLLCEHLAGDALRAHGQSAADSEIVAADGRLFLQSTRFDRTPVLGRRGFISLAALDAGYYGHGHIDWWRFAPQLQRDGWIDADAARRLRVLGLFGTLIANSDMHLGNAGVVLADARPLALVPAYDMLPMHFRPAASGEVVPRDYLVTLPTPEVRDDWRTAATAAVDFWQRASDDDRISGDFRAIAAGAATALGHAIARIR